MLLPQLIDRTTPTEGSRHVQSDLAAHRVSIERLEVEVFIRYADVAWVAHQRQDHLHRTLHVRPLCYTLKALEQIPDIVFNTVTLNV